MIEEVHKIEVGNRVRSFDFEGKTDCFVEGRVYGFEELEGCMRYKILVDRRVFNGESLNRFETWVYPPVNGTPKLFGGVCNGVEKMPEVEA